MVIKIEAFYGLFESIVFIHRHDVLKSKLLRDLRAKTQCAYYLAPVDPIE